MATHTRTATEIKAIIQAERSGAPFLVWRDGESAQQILDLGALERATVGRGARCDVVLAQDEEVSRTHAELELLGEDWAVSDDGLSRNGTFVNGVRLAGRKRLSHGDELRLGETVIEYRHPADTTSQETTASSSEPVQDSLTNSQRRVLVALCRPYKDDSAFATPATNSQIATELFVTVDAVKATLRALFQRFGVGELPQNQKRARLVELALRSGVVSRREL